MISLLVSLMLAADGGTPADAGRAAVSTWTAFDGGQPLHGNVTDDVVLTVGQSIAIQFPQQVSFSKCDDLEILGISDTETSFVFKALKPGTTHCGFWYSQNAFPHRYVEIVIKPR